MKQIELPKSTYQQKLKIEMKIDWHISGFFISSLYTYGAYPKVVQGILMNSPERYYFGGDRTKPVKKSDPPIFFQVSYLSHGAEVIKKIAFDNQLWLLRPVIMERGNLCLSTLTRAIVFFPKDK